MRMSIAFPSRLKTAVREIGQPYRSLTAKQKLSIRLFAYAIPALLGFLSASCTQIVLNGGRFDPWNPNLVLGSLTFAALYGVLYRAMERRSMKKGFTPPLLSKRWHVVCDRLNLRFALRSVAKAAPLLFVCWLPYLLVLKPGVYWWDTTYQVMQFLDFGSPLIDHHPVMDTMLFGSASRLGYEITGSYFTGLYGLIVVQSLLTCCALAAFCCLLERFGVSPSIRGVLLLFFALFPFFPVFCSALSKDSISLPFFIGFYICFAEMWRRRAASPKLVACLFLCAVIASMTKKTALLIVLPSMLTFIPILRNWRLRVSLLVLSVVAWAVALVTVPKVVEAIHGYTPGGRQEILAVPLQQAANIVVKARNEIEPRELDVLQDTYLYSLDELAERYSYQVVDGVKGGHEAPNADYTEFLRIWAGLVVRKPVLAFEAWCGLTAGWFSYGAPQLNPPIASSNVNEKIKELPGWDAGGDWNESLDGWYGQLLTIPVLNLLFSRALWGSFIPGYLAFSSLRAPRGHRMSRLVLYAPVLLTVASLLVGPTSLTREAVRYIAPLVFVLPCLIAMQNEMIRMKYEKAR